MAIVENRVNVVTEKWISTINGKVSLLDVARGNAGPLVGTALEKMAVTYFLLAIAQAACTPEDEEEWVSLTLEEFGRKIEEYLLSPAVFENMYLYGLRPFLQSWSCETSAWKNIDLFRWGGLYSENAPFISDRNRPKKWTDCDKINLLVQLCTSANGGKKSSLTFDPAVKGKTPKNAPALGMDGLAHAFLITYNLRETLYLNLLTKDQIADLGKFDGGVGVPPIEEMPVSKNDEVFKRLEDSLMGVYMPVGRFVLLHDNYVSRFGEDSSANENNIKVVEGMTYREGKVSPFCVMDKSTVKGVSYYKAKSFELGNYVENFFSLFVACNATKDDKKDKKMCPGLFIAVDRLKTYQVIDGYVNIMSYLTKFKNKSGEILVSSGCGSRTSSISIKQEDLISSSYTEKIFNFIEYFSKVKKHLESNVARYIKDIGCVSKFNHLSLFMNKVEVGILPILFRRREDLDDYLKTLERKLELYANEAYDEAIPDKSINNLLMKVKYTPYPVGLRRSGVMGFFERVVSINDTALKAELKRYGHYMNEHKVLSFLDNYFKIDVTNRRLVDIYKLMLYLILKHGGSQNGEQGLGALVSADELGRLCRCSSVYDVCQFLKTKAGKIFNKKEKFPDFNKIFGDLLYFNNKTSRKWMLEFVIANKNNKEKKDVI